MAAKIVVFLLPLFLMRPEKIKLAKVGRFFLKQLDSLFFFDNFSLLPKIAL